MWTAVVVIAARYRAAVVPAWAAAVIVISAGHVAAVVGGFVRSNLWYGDADRMWEPVPAARQREAVAFLHRNAFETPASLILPDVLDRLETSGVAERILNHQRSLLTRLLSTTRVRRMAAP